MARATDDPFTVQELRDMLHKLTLGMPVYIYNRYAGVPERFVIAETVMFTQRIAMLWPTGTAMDGSSLHDDQEILCPKCWKQMRWQVGYDEGNITGAVWVHAEESDCDGG